MSRVHVPVGTCARCDRPIYSRNRTGLCRTHSTAEWKRANAARTNEHNRRYNAKKPQVMRTSRQRWAVANPDKIADAQAVRRARKQGQFVEKVYRSKVLRDACGLCGICGDLVDPARFDVDHIVPLAHGGEHSYANTQPAHPLCNQRKGGATRARAKAERGAKAAS